MSEARRILLVGATGLVGRTIIAQTPHLSGITLQGLARREIVFPKGARMELVLAESKEWPGIIAQLQPDAIICALGTTRRKAGSKEAFRAVDHDLVLDVARAAKSAEVPNFVHVSSVGADAYSKNSYLRVKGETERDLKALKLHRLDILRPGLLRGKREDDLRPAELAGQVLAPVADLFLHGSKAKYRSIRAVDLAEAALQASAIKAAGRFVHDHQALMLLAQKFRREQALLSGRK